MKTLVVLLCFVLLAFAHKGSKSGHNNKHKQDCVFQGDSGDRIDLSRIAGKVFTVNETVIGHNTNSTWYWTVCGNLSEIAVCPPSSAICFVENGKASNWGNASTVQISAKELHPDGVTLAFAGEMCSYGILRSASLHFHCDWNAVTPKVTTMNKYTCNVDFTIASIYACDTTVDSENGSHLVMAPFLVVFFISFMTFACCICLCACCRRRIHRKQQQKRELEMIQYSNVAFQPIPQEEQKEETKKTVRQSPPAPGRLPHPVPVQHIPAYYPPVSQLPVQPVQLQPPQFFLYPSVQHPVQFQPASFTQPATNTVAKREEQVTDDEKLARELQAQFDREAQQ